VKELLVVYREKALFILDAVVFHFVLEANTECVIAGKVCTFAHKEQTVFAGLE